MTLEEAMKENLRLQDELKKATETNAALTKAADESKTRIEKLQEINQEYYLRITSDRKPDNKPEDKPKQTTEEFAASIADKF